jgi:hypothetical protein
MRISTETPIGGVIAWLHQQSDYINNLSRFAVIEASTGGEACCGTEVLD